MTTTQRIELAYVLDTNILIRVLTNKSKLSTQVAAIFEAAARGETHLVIPAIVVAELFYSDKKWSLFDDFNKVYSEMKT